MQNEEGVKVNSDLSDDLTNILQGANLNETQSLFLQQQIKANQCKRSCGMRWHPTLIRFALSIYLPGAYKQLHDSGFIRLPSTSTLYDYSHATEIKPGIDTTVLESLAKRATSEDNTFKQYHVLMADEVHISKNLCV